MLDNLQAYLHASLSRWQHLAVRGIEAVSLCHVLSDCSTAHSDVLSFATSACNHVSVLNHQNAMTFVHSLQHSIHLSILL